MNTRKRNRKMNETEKASTQQIELKISRTQDNTHTDEDSNADNSNEHKIDTSAETMNMDENELATGSAEQPNNNLPEFEQNAKSTSVQETNGFRMDDHATDDLLREADVLLAAVSEIRREVNHNVVVDDSVNIDSQATIIIDPSDVSHSATTTVQNESTQAEGNATTASTSTQARISDMEVAAYLDDSVVHIDDISPRTVRSVVKDDDDQDVIFVTESRGSQRFRTIATIDLCDTPDTSYNQPNTVAESSTTVRQKIKCPICMESYGLDEIRSTMCGHLYCDPCIKNVIKIRKKCPMCNRSLKPNQVHRLFFDA